MREELRDPEIDQYLKRYGKVRSLPIEPKNISSNVLPFEVESENEKYAVFVYNWKKSIGTDVLIRIENKISELNRDYDGIIIIGNKFSINARDIVEDMNKKGKKPLLLIKRSEITTIIDSAR